MRAPVPARSSLAVVCALRVEAAALRRRVGAGVVTTTGMGPVRARDATARLAASLGPATPVAVTGVAGGTRPELRPGTVLVASEVRGEGSVWTLPSAPLLAGALRRAGLPVVVGPLVSSDTLVRGEGRDRLAHEGALGVDMETAAVLGALGPLGERPLAVARVVADTAGTGARGVPKAGLVALRTLAGLPPHLDAWAAACQPRRVVLAAPRSFCAGVERAIEIVSRALERFGPPVYVRRQIVHNSHVVADLESRGAVFVQELDEVPDGATVVFSAHGVAPAVREEAARRDLDVVDATCPLVAKVHIEARRFAAQGREVVLIGHAGHDEVEGTLGEAGGRIHLVERPEDVGDLPIPVATPVARLTQTTLAPDQVAGVVEALEARFADLVAPSADDICYATQNRQEALARCATEADLVLVASSANSSNGNRLVELARRLGARAHLVDRAEDLDLAWLENAGTVAISAAASTPERVVTSLLDALSGLGRLSIEERSTTLERVRFPLPQEVRSCPSRGDRT
jgi:4-hydroxy-3-methylbut-2-enyl diphosphate reductase